MADDTDSGFEDGASSNPFATGKSSHAAPNIDPDELESGNGDRGASTGGGTGSDPGTGKRRGRKPGSKNGTTKKSKDGLDISGLEKILFSVHLALSAATKVPELRLDQDEARELAKAAANVQSHYEASIVDPKTMAWIQLGMVAASVYGPRVMSYSLRTKAEKDEKRKQRSNVVTGNFPHAPAG